MGHPISAEGEERREDATRGATWNEATTRVELKVKLAYICWYCRYAQGRRATTLPCKNAIHDKGLREEVQYWPSVLCQARKEGMSMS